ncbi:MAG: ABC transporter substrate-binding protein [Bacteroidales bacterium]|nr:ABC transporter substrate-binding protein [Bacteroidales bacterium]MCF8344829.1 ABC transporter substrate-binding protein [Bacteroidales bacterium]MCF8351724.1 ABC transporter substrate-binding protein [Bacteroidales bacterium]MCF8377046.1 ABC transporter substrate-binding protein [Bacteroidales bacterium]MCF8400920.1 ABC transporter substrate-binding protein [Bacteroidales bacterium]
MKAVTDALGREVMIPEKIETVIALRSGALRLLAYMDATDRVIAVEGNEKRRTVPYLFANPRLKELDVIGTGNLAEPELLAMHQPDLILTTYTTAGEAEELQQKTAVPVVVLDYGDFNENIDRFYNTLDFLGRILNKQKRADSLKTFIEECIVDLDRRTKGLTHRSNVYVGGIAYCGAHGIASTEPRYAAFRMVHANNVAAGLGEVTSSPKAWLENAFIDPEQLIEWNPDKFFLDISGRTVWEEDLQNTALASSLQAIQGNELYTVLPHNWYTINYENILCNAYYIGKVMYPEAFEDIELRKKCDEIYKNFLGKGVYAEMMEAFDAYRQIKITQ